MIKKPRFMLFPIVGMLLLFGQNALAFQDIQGDPAQAKIEALQKAGTISGLNEDTFDPKGVVTVAQGIQMIVKGLNLNLDNMQFIKEPQASDSFDNVPNDAWYAPAMIAAIHHGVPLPRDTQPNSIMTRETFATYLDSALHNKITYPTIKIWMIIKDEQDISPASVSAIQDLLIIKVANLKDGNFRPKAEITRSEAVDMLYNTIEFVKTHSKSDAVGLPPAVGREEVSFQTTPINSALNKVVLSRGTKPNTGYAITIKGIDFTADGQAVIRYTLQNPVPGHMYAQVLTEPQAVTYVDSKYKITLKQE
jgi:hypothetical protein